MADAYREKFDDVTKAVPQPGAGYLQRNGNNGVEVWAQVASGSPIVVKPPVPLQTDPKYYEKAAERAAAIAKLKGGGMSTNPVFQALTGMTHEQLLNHWGTHDIGSLTSCNAFAGRVCGNFGCGYLGGFNLESLCAANGRSECWVPASSGEKPRYGDLFESRSGNVGFENLHIGFSLQFDSSSAWWTLEGGQGGPVLGFDRVARLKKTYSTAHMLGWVDMRKMAGFEKALPSWLLGTWLIFIGDKRHVYQVDRLGGVSELAFAPVAGNTDLPTVDTAGVTLVTSDTVKLNWMGEHGIETVTYDRAGSTGFVKRLKGTSAAGIELTGAKLF